MEEEKSFELRSDQALHVLDIIGATSFRFLTCVINQTDGPNIQVTAVNRRLKSRKCFANVAIVPKKIAINVLRNS